MKLLKGLVEFLSECFAPSPPLRPNEANLRFMVCEIKINFRKAGWQKGIRKVLRSTVGVREVKMSRDGKVQVSGMVDVALLMKMLAKAGKSANLTWLQSGRCSSNLFLPPQPPKPRINNGFPNQGPFRNVMGFHHPQFALPPHGGFHGLPPPPPMPPLGMPVPPMFYDYDSRNGYDRNNCNTM